MLGFSPISDGPLASLPTDIPAQDLTATLLSNVNVFFTPSVTSEYTLEPTLFSDGDTLYTPTVSTSYTLEPTLFSNTNTVFTPTVSAEYTLYATLFVNDNNFFGGTIGTSDSPIWVLWDRRRPVKQGFGYG